MPADIIRMLARVAVVQLDNLPPGVSGPCWQWTGTPDRKDGYGAIKLNGKKQWVHRVSFAVFHEDRGEGMHIDHRCHNRLCINPAHLDARTATDNCTDGINYRWDRVKGMRINFDEAPPSAPAGPDSFGGDDFAPF
ncbi:MAG: HNH endonuclease [Tepidisphaeraceae bacterium]